MYTSKETVKVLLYDLKGHPKNPKKHNDALIQKSITELGYAENIVIDENNVILAGHGRVDALKKTSGAEGGGMEIEAVRITGWTEEEKEKYLLLSNQTTILGGLDYVKLNEISPDVLKYSGFDDFIVQSLDDLVENKAEEERKGMPEFQQENKEPMRRIVVGFRSQEDIDMFAKLIDQNLTPQTKAIWFPKAERAEVIDKAYVSESEPLS